jgi:hypothetical protein
MRTKIEIGGSGAGWRRLVLYVLIALSGWTLVALATAAPSAHGLWPSTRLNRPWFRTDPSAPPQPCSA